VVYDSVLDQLRRSYDHAAEERNRGEIQPWKLPERDRVLAWFALSNAHRLLEIGAGAGKDSLFFQQNGLDVTCADLSPEMVRLCRDKGLSAHQMDFLHLDFPAASFDAVYAMNCLLHVPKADLPRVLTAIHALLRPGGVFYMGIYGGIEQDGIWDQDRYQPPRYFAFYPDDQIRAIVKAHFIEEDFRTISVLEDPAGMHFQALMLNKR
jgi:SAM-dependent methyltransferase